MAATDASAPTFTGCTFSGNTETAVNKVSGAIYAKSSSVTVRDCTIENLTGSAYGSGIYNDGGTATITNCIFRGTAGAIATVGSSTTTVTDCQFLNSIDLKPAIEQDHGTLRVTNCSFLNGSASAPVVYLFSETTSFFTKSLFKCNANRCIKTFLGTTQISGCRFEGNNTTPVDLFGTATVSDSVFIRNTAISGAAMTCSGDVSIDRCVMKGNVATGDGGAIVQQTGTLKLTNCEIVGNRANRGGGISVQGGTITLVNSTVAYNVAAVEGGGIYQRDENLSASFIKNSIVWGNAAQSGPQIRSQGGLVTATYSDVQGGWGVASEHNIDTIPMFLRTPSPGADATWGTVDDDYGDLRLQINSPAIDAAENAALPAGITIDLLKHPRFLDQPLVNDPGAIVDMGAYEAGFFAESADYPLTDSKPSVAIALNFDLNPSSLNSGDLILRNLDTNQLVDTAGLATVAYDPATRTARWSFASPLPDGNYRATLSANALQDTAVRPLAVEFSYYFFILTADANHDRFVNVADFAIFSANYMGTGKTFATGDFDYDGDCDNADLAILSANWSKYLAPPPPPQVQPVVSPPPPTTQVSPSPKKTRTITTIVV